MILKRITYGSNRTFGVLIDQGTPFVLTLEDAWRGNEVNVSCIPEAEYLCRRVDSPKFGDVFEVTNVPGRSSILIHKGNTEEDTSGCVLIGEQFGFLYGQPAILNSGVGFDELMKRLADEDEFTLCVC